MELHQRDSRECRVRCLQSSTKEYDLRYDKLKESLRLNGWKAFGIQRRRRGLLAARSFGERESSCRVEKDYHDH